MLRKRSRAMGEPLFTLPSLFVSQVKGPADSDSARSPISPLEPRVFGRKSWDSDRVGLGLVDSLADAPTGLIVSGSSPRSGDGEAPPLTARRRFIGSFESSEDYTRIISRGANPKTTHIFGDCVVELVEDGGWLLDCAAALVPLPRENFLCFCDGCEKKLDGEDIYMYRGEKAFCSNLCRSRGMMEEELDSSGEPPEKWSD
ncbi:FCS-Like Zinc finger 10 [Wolffia australiana]